ncbi:MAG: radical SAM family heme chaperone HemW [Phycisphaerales bacterium]|jgi:oxygen-independent coproporphyrinogen III oxidase|nr:radical SAM family heme chaperone HemW [Phycisphaerales bacterium]
MQAQSLDSKINPTPNPAVGAIYVHIPFCASKCGYCDFYSLADTRDLAQACVKAICLELKSNEKKLTLPLSSIFVGGGTPTSLAPPLLAELLDTLGQYRNEQTEFSVEANPSSITDQTAKIMHHAGVNRVNLGAQSFVQKELTALGRIHDPDRIATAWRTLRDAGHQRLGLDLIYASPGQNLDSWRYSLDQALALEPQHLSCYALTVESDTPIGRLRDSGEFVEMDEADQANCYNAAVQTTAAAGLEQYEISNFAAPGMQCQHNLTYWRNESYLGLGPAAASYIDRVRRTNKPDIKAYIRAIENDQPPPAESEKLTGRAEMGETIMLALRMTQGVDRQQFAQRFGIDPVEAFGATIQRYCDMGAMLMDRQRIRIAPRAMLVSNTILADILSEA